MIRSNLPWPTSNPRARQEWDFRPPYLPGREVLDCHEYELGRIRQSDAWRKSIIEFRKTTGGTTFDDHLHYVNNHKLRESSVDWPYLFYTLWPEWPDTPYLAVEAKERSRRMQRWDIEKPMPLPAVSFGDIFRNHTYAIASLRTGLPAPPDLKEFGDVIEYGSGSFTAAMGVCLHFSDQQLHESFQQNLDSWRRKYGIRNPESRGAAAAIKRLRGELCAIGLWRLLCSGMNRQQAIVFTQKHSGKPLIADHRSAWSRALKTAKEIIPHQFHYLKRLTDKKSNRP